MAKQLTWHRAIVRVLTEAGSPLHYQEITERIIADGLRTSLGATPASSVSVTITSSIRKLGADSPFVRIAKGVFALAESASRTQVSRRDASEDDFEEQYDIISSFGMFWRREQVDWTSTPKLLGMQQIGATAVDFCNQLGIYLLYDRREVIYVGRSTDRPIGRRLYEHTKDRMSTRWDRFSWFGLLLVTENGKLNEMPSTFGSQQLIPALEAILIEALEPRQNRKRGDDLASVEYIQSMTRELEEKRAFKTLEAAFKKR